MACFSHAAMMPTSSSHRFERVVVPMLLLVMISTAARAQEAIGAVNANFTPGIRAPTTTIQPIKPLPPWKMKQSLEDRSARRFLLLSTGVYAAATMDMQESASLRPRFHEDDPLAKPFAKLPLPAYYATGLAFATGLNWLGWRMAHSERWHSVWWLPQVCSIAGNLMGYAHTKTHENRR
jgi:hypothetical protein